MNRSKTMYEVAREQLIQEIKKSKEFKQLRSFYLRKSEDELIQAIKPRTRTLRRGKNIVSEIDFLDNVSQITVKNRIKVEIY